MEGASVQANNEVYLKSTAEESGEDTPLVQRTPSHWSVLAVRYRNTRKCISSKAALLILFWSLAVLLAWSASGNLMQIQSTFISRPTYLSVAYGFLGVAHIFSPLAGFLADVKFGCYKTVLGSLYLMIPSLVVLALVMTPVNTLTTLAATGFCCSGKFTKKDVWIPIVGCIAYIVLFAGYVGFFANVIQFGMDQLYDSPGEDRTLFIHWYVWIMFISDLIAQLAWTMDSSYAYTQNTDSAFLITGRVMVAAVLVMVIVLLIVSVCLGHHKRRWFLIEPGKANPYKLVYKVSKFAYQHRTPVYRSAFTYCEDEIPSGLDLGKDKYGGPFTTEEVEDVKAFYGILKVLFVFGVETFLNFGANVTLSKFTLYNTSPSNTSWAQEILINEGVLSPLLIVVCLPLYLFLLRPFISYYIPGMLKRMGIGMCLVLLSLMLTFSMDIIIHHYMHNNSLCMFNKSAFSPREPNASNSTPPSLHLDATFNYVLIVQYILSAISSMLIIVAIFEFICSQSPHSMKGLLIGLWYAIRGFCQILAAALAVPYSFWSKSLPVSCGFGYYLMNILIGIVAVLVYVCVARRYKYRERDEPCHVRRYAEEYYSDIIARER